MCGGLNFNLSLSVSHIPHHVYYQESIYAKTSIEKERLVENAANQGEYALKRLNEMRDEHKLMGDVRGKGL